MRVLNWGSLGNGVYTPHILTHSVEKNTKLCSHLFNPTLHCMFFLFFFAQLHCHQVVCNMWATTHPTGTWLAVSTSYVIPQSLSHITDSELTFSKFSLSPQPLEPFRDRGKDEGTMSHIENKIPKKRRDKKRYSRYFDLIRNVMIAANTSIIRPKSRLGFSFSWLVLVRKYSVCYSSHFGGRYPLGGCQGALEGSQKIGGKKTKFFWIIF